MTAKESARHEAERNVEVISVRVPASLKSALEEIAAADRRSLAFIVKDALEAYVQAHAPKTKKR